MTDRMWIAMRCAVMALLVATACVPAAAVAQPTPPVRTYVVDGVRSSLDRSAVVATGAAIVEVDHASVTVSASPQDARRLRRLRFTVSAAAAPRPPASQRRTRAFPAADSGFHTYQEVIDETAAVVAAHPSIASRTQIGTSFEGRPIYALKISDNVATDEDEPEVLLTHGQHAREHLTVEMAMYELNELTSAYASDARIKNVVDTREIWIVPSLNPDGAEFDVAGGAYALWRKNRQPTAGSSAIGTDLNRNWSWQWGCCRGSSGSPASETFRGAAPFSAPETAAVRDFVASRRIGGAQQIAAGIDVHAYGEQVLWPYGYTTADTAAGMTTDQRDTFAALGQSMARANGYTAAQDSDLYIVDGAIDDWMWGQEGIFDFTFEMYPRGDDPGFYPPDEAIAAQTSRNREAVLRLLEVADCPYRAIGKQAQYCPGAPEAAPVAGVPAGSPPGFASTTSHTRIVTTATPLRSRVTVARNGRLRLRLRCRASGSARCRGTITLRSRLPGARRTSTIARQTYVLAASTKTVGLRLRQPARRALRARTSLTATAKVSTRRPGARSGSRFTRVQLVRRR